MWGEVVLFLSLLAANNTSLIAPGIIPLVWSVTPPLIYSGVVKRDEEDNAKEDTRDAADEAHNLV